MTRTLLFLAASNEPDRPIDESDAACAKANEEGDDDAASAWAADELAVSICRTAIAYGLQIATPVDDEFAPLFAQVALQSLGPKFAEGEARDRVVEGASGWQAPVVFIDMQRTRVKATVPPPPWLQLFAYASGFSAEPVNLDAPPPDTRTIGAVTIGDDSAVMLLLDQLHAATVPVLRLGNVLGDHGMDKSIRHDFLSRAYAQARADWSRVEILNFVGEDVQDRFEREAHRGDFDRYQPFALYGQMLVEELLEGQARERPEPL